MRRIAFLMICAAFLSCGDDDPTNPGPGGEIYPLAVGNTWTFEVTYFDSLGVVESQYNMTATIVGDTVIEGETWYISESANNEGIHNGLCILRSDGLYADWPEERLLYKYPARVGDSYIVEDDTVSVEDLDETVNVPAGEFDCVRYRIHGVYPVLIYQRLSVGVGPVSVEVYMERDNREAYLGLRILLISYSLQ